MSFIRATIAVALLGIGAVGVWVVTHDRAVTRISDRLNAGKSHDFCQVRLGAGSTSPIDIVDRNDLAIPSSTSDEQGIDRIRTSFEALRERHPVLDNFFHCESRPWISALSSGPPVLMETDTPSMEFVSEILANPDLLRSDLVAETAFPDPNTSESSEPLRKADRESFKYPLDESND